MQSFEKVSDRLRRAARHIRFRGHMPGHKGGPWPELSELINLGMDWTELPQTDDLHHPVPGGSIEGLLRRAEGHWGASQIFFYGNGSTGANLTALHALLPEGGRVLLNRGVHRSILNGLALRKADLFWMDTHVIRDGLSPALPEDWEAVVSRHSGFLERQADPASHVDLIVLTSPTYEGRFLKTETLARWVAWARARGARILLDAAHGAHLQLGLWAELAGPDLAVDPFQAGVDAVVMSLHKTLPMPTGTAVLALNPQLAQEGDCALLARFQRAYRIFETSSPSFLNLLALESLLDYFENGARSDIQAFFEARAALDRRLSAFDWGATGQPASVRCSRQDGEGARQGARQGAQGVRGAGQHEAQGVRGAGQHEAQGVRGAGQHEAQGEYGEKTGQSVDRSSPRSEGCGQDPMKLHWPIGPWGERVSELFAEAGFAPEYCHAMGCLWILGLRQDWSPLLKAAELVERVRMQLGSDGLSRLEKDPCAADLWPGSLTPYPARALLEADWTELYPPGIALSLPDPASLC